MFWKNHFFATETSSAAYYGGRGISIAVLDTGISPVADFTEPENRIVAFLDLVNGKTEPYDDNGHGTHLTGTVANLPIKNRLQKMSIFHLLYPALESIHNNKKSPPSLKRRRTFYGYRFLSISPSS